MSDRSRRRVARKRFRRHDLVIGHFSFPVVASEELTRRQDGGYQCDPRMIRISPDLEGGELLNALVHELIHAFLALDAVITDAGGPMDEDLEERVANCLGNRLSEALIRNRWLRDLVGGGDGGR